MDLFQPGPCLARSSAVDAENRAPCFIVEAIRVDDPSAGCNAPARALMCEQRMIDAIEAHPELATEQPNVFCEVEQLSGESLRACQFDLEEPTDAAGWCYIDGASGIGNPELVADCPAAEARRIRFVGAGELPRAGGQLFLTCGEDP